MRARLVQEHTTWWRHSAASRRAWPVYQVVLGEGVEEEDGDGHYGQEECPEEEAVHHLGQFVPVLGVVRLLLLLTPSPATAGRHTGSPLSEGRVIVHAQVCVRPAAHVHEAGSLRALASVHRAVNGDNRHVFLAVVVHQGRGHAPCGLPLPLDVVGDAFVLLGRLGLVRADAEESRQVA